MNMGRKKSKRSTKDTTRQNLSDTPSGNSASAALIGGGSSQSTPRNVASADAIRSKSLQSMSRNTSLELNPNSRHITLHTGFGSSPSVTSQSTSRNTASVTVPKNPRVSSQTSKNSASASVKGKSSQSATKSDSSLMLENQKDSSEIASRNLAAASDSVHSTSRSKASGAAKGRSLQSTGTASVGASRGGSSQSTARGKTSVGAAQGRYLQSTTRDTDSTGSGRDGSSQSTVKSSTLVYASRGGSIESRTRSTDSVGASRGKSLQSTTRSTVSTTVPAAGRNRTEETNSRHSTFIGAIGAAFIDNARREISLPTTRNSTSVTSPVASQTTQTNNVERRDPILYPIFFVIKNVDGSEVNSIEIENILGRLECITPLRDRSMLIKTKSQSESNIISNLTTICNKPVSVVPHSALNSSQGTIFCKGLQMCSNEEVLDHLRSQHVTKVYHFRKKINGILVDTPRLLLTFDTPQPPKKIKVGFLWFEVRLFSPTPRRCFSCQSFTHISKYCTATPVCPLCGETGHTYPPRCNNPIRCVNCFKDDHTATSSECETFKMEKKVLELHARKKIGIAEARLRIANQILSGRLKV